MFCRPMALTIPLGVSHMRGAGAPAMGSRKALHDDSAEPVQVHQVGELDPVAKSAAGRNDGVFERNEYRR